MTHQPRHRRVPDRRPPRRRIHRARKSHPLLSYLAALAIIAVGVWLTVTYLT